MTQGVAKASESRTMAPSLRVRPGLPEGMAACRNPHCDPIPSQTMLSDLLSPMRRGRDLLSITSYAGLFDLAFQAFGGEREAEDWLLTIQAPWDVLPAYHARTEDGAAEVESRLRSILRRSRPEVALLPVRI